MYFITFQISLSLAWGVVMLNYAAAAIVTMKVQQNIHNKYIFHCQLSLSTIHKIIFLKEHSNLILTISCKN